MKTLPRLFLIAVVAFGMLAMLGGCMTRAEHTATLSALEGPALRVADEYTDWAKALAGDSDGDGRVTDADDFDAARAKLQRPPLTKETAATSRDVWLRARLRRDAELRGVFDDVRAPTTQGS